MTHGAVRWSLAAAFVTAAHAAVWLAFTSPSAEPELDAGAPVMTVELSPIVSAPASDNSETDAQASAAPAASPGAASADPARRPTTPPKAAPPPPPEPPPVTETTDVFPAPPQVAPTPAPDLSSPPPPPPPDPSPPKETPATVEPPPPPSGAAPAPPPSPSSAASAHVADVAAAPAPALGSEETVAPPALRRWRQELIGQIERHKHYPAGAKGLAGMVRVAFAIDPTGRLVSVSIAASSGSPVLDEAAIDLIRRAEPFPPPPASLGAGELSFVAPIRYVGATSR